MPNPYPILGGQGRSDRDVWDYAKICVWLGMAGLGAGVWYGIYLLWGLI